MFTHRAFFVREIQGICMYLFKFEYGKGANKDEMYILAGSVRQAKEKAELIKQGLVYTNDYEEYEPDPFQDQEIAWICSTPSDELPFPFKQGKKLALLFAYGTNCQCCLGYRIIAGLLVGGLIGYLI